MIYCYLLTQFSDLCDFTSAVSGEGTYLFCQYSTKWLFIIDESDDYFLGELIHCLVNKMSEM